MGLEKKIFVFFKKNKIRGIDNSLSSICHLSSSFSSLGYNMLKLWKKESFGSFRLIIQYLKHVVSIGYQSKLLLIKKEKKYNFNKLILTWAYKKNFLKNGSLNDRYFNYNSKIKKDFLWLVLYLDKQLPKKINENIILFKINKTSFNLFYFIKVVSKTIIKINFNLFKLPHVLSSSSNLAINLVESIKNQINFKKIKSIITPFEGQPFQQYLFKFVQKKYKSINTIGYLSHTHTLQYDIFFREGSPKQLLTHSEDQKKYIQSKLGWSKKRVKLIPSMRFLKNTGKKNILNKILFPYDFRAAQIFLLNFEKFLISSKNKSLPNFKIKVHPAPYSAKKQNKLKDSISSIIKKYSKKFAKKSKKKFCIILGLSSSVIYALEQKLNVIHITDENYFESFEREYWPNIFTKKLSNNVLFYKLKKFNKCILFGEKKFNLEKNF